MNSPDMVMMYRYAKTPVSQAGSTTFLRDRIVPPRLDGINRINQVPREDLESLRGAIWRDLLYQFGNPIRERMVGDARKYRRVEFLGVLRYDIDQKTGYVSTSHLTVEGNTYDDDDYDYIRPPLRFERPAHSLVVDLPLKVTPFWLECYLHFWETQIRTIACCSGTHAVATAQLIRAWLVRGLYKAIMQSVNWEQLRYALRSKLNLEAQVLDYCRRGRTNKYWQPVHDFQYNRTLALFNNYRRLDQDAPNLLWLYTLACEEEVKLPSGEVLQSLRQRLLADGVTPKGWRMLLKSKRKDFDVALLHNGKDRWSRVVNWLKLHEALERKEPIPAKLTPVFSDTFWGVDDDGVIFFRGMKIKPRLLQKLLDEYARQQQLGTEQTFLSDEVADVLSWIQSVNPELDSNQLNAGWKHLVRRAADWKRKEMDIAEFISILCPNFSQSIEIDGYCFMPLRNAWEIRNEAIRMRHCGDSYIADCMQGNYRMFSVRSNDGRLKATLGIIKVELRWEQHDLRGFANQMLGEAIYDVVEELLTRINNGSFN